MGRKYVEGIDFDKIDEVNAIAESIAKEWGIDEDLAIDIVGSEYHNMLDQFMFITSAGEVQPANNEKELREAILDYLQNQEGCLVDIEYIFVNGEKMDMGIDIQFNKQEDTSFDPKEIEKMNNVPEPSMDADMYPMGQEAVY